MKGESYDDFNGTPQFDKKYSYGIRYNYGKEGKKTDYTPFGCMKIIMNNAPAAGDAHGKSFACAVLKNFGNKM